MAYPYAFHPEAEEELFDAIDYLDTQREGYGALLADAAASILDSITENPLRYPVVSESQRRRALLPTPFHKSYAVYFDFDGEKVVILCFFNNRRDPSVWQRR